MPIGSNNGQPTGAQGPGTTEGGAYHDVGNQTLFGRNAGAKFFIPTEDEWYKAAYHDKTAGLAASYFDYPTGSNTAPINTLPDPGNHANFYDDFGTGNNSYTIGSPYYRTEVGRICELGQSLRHVRSRRQRVGVERNGDQFVAWSAWRVVRREPPPGGGLSPKKRPLVGRVLGAACKHTPPSLGLCFGVLRGFGEVCLYDGGGGKNNRRRRQGGPRRSWGDEGLPS